MPNFAAKNKSEGLHYVYTSGNHTSEPTIHTNAEVDIGENHTQANVATGRSLKQTATFTAKTASDELFLMDSYYKELIKKERAAFERVLASKLNV